MRSPVRLAFAGTAVGLVGAVSFVASALSPPGSRTWLVVFGVLAVAMAVQAVSSEPRDLIPAILFALVPVVALASEGAPAWLGAPFAVLLLLAGEASALSWEVPAGSRGGPGFLRPRVAEAAILAVLGLAAAAAVGVVGRVEVVGGTPAVAMGAGALGVLALVLFGRRREGGGSTWASRVSSYALDTTGARDGDGAPPPKVGAPREEGGP